MTKTTLTITMIAIFAVGGLVGYLVAGSDASTMLGGFTSKSVTKNKIASFVNNAEVQNKSEQQGFEMPKDLKMITVHYYQNTEDVSSSDFIEKLELAGKNPKVYGMEIVQYKDGVEQNKEGSRLEIHNPSTCNWLPAIQ